MPPILVAVLQIVGLLVVAGGLFMQWPWVGVTFAGLATFGYVVASDYLSAVSGPPRDL